jgi:Tfp pilus assembly protein PilF
MDQVRQQHSFWVETRAGARWVLVAGLACLLTGIGCTTTTFTVDGLEPVSEAVAKRDLGVDYLGTGRTALAIRELSTSLSLDSSDPQTHLWLGEAYRRKGRVETAEKYLVEAIEKAEKKGDSQTAQDARLNLSALLSQMGRYEDSLEICEELVEDPMVSAPWRPLTNCAWVLIQLGRLDEARDRLREALDYFPRFGPALLSLGIVEAKQGHRLAAIDAFERALDSRLGGAATAEANYRLGELFVAMGRRDQAVGHFRAAAERAPNLDWGAQSQAYLELLQ